MENEIQQMVEWINSNDVFWLSDFKARFGVLDESSPGKKRSENFNIATKLISQLKDQGCIQCCGRKSAERQYILIKKIDFTHITAGARGRRKSKK